MALVVDAKDSKSIQQFPAGEKQDTGRNKRGGGGAAGNRSPATDTDPGSNPENTPGSGKNRQPTEMILRLTD